MNGRNNFHVSIKEMLCRCYLERETRVQEETESDVIKKAHVEMRIAACVNYFWHAAYDSIILWFIQSEGRGIMAECLAIIGLFKRF